jgi:hypothetical protein
MCGDSVDEASLGDASMMTSHTTQYGVAVRTFTGKVQCVVHHRD